MKLKEVYKILPERTILTLYNERGKIITSGYMYCFNKKYFDNFKEYKVTEIRAISFDEMDITIDYEK